LKGGKRDGGTSKGQGCGEERRKKKHISLGKLFVGKKREFWDRRKRERNA